MTASPDAPPSPTADVPYPHCPHCDYNLSHQTAGRCPECGAALTPADFLPTNIPWMRSRGIGRVWGFAKTVWYVLFKPSCFQREFERGVSYRRAQVFRWLCVLIAWVATAVNILLPFGDTLVRDLNTNSSFEKPATYVCAIILLLVAWAAITGIPSYFFHPRSLSTERQNRAIALSYYATAALALAPLGPALLFVGALVAAYDETTQMHVLQAIGWFLSVAGVLFPAFVLFLYLLVIVQMGERLLPGDDVTGLFVGAKVLVSWIVAAALIFIGLPTLLLLVYIVLLCFT